MLTQLGIELRHGSAKLPKGAIFRLRRAAEERSIPLATDRAPTPVPVAVIPPLEWNVIGHERATRILSYDEVVGIHEALVDDFATSEDPISPPGIKSADLLQSAVFRQETSLGPQRKYPTPELVGAALLHSLALNHAFHNGNKRTALVSMLVCLDENDVLFTCDEDDLFRLVLTVAQHRLVDRRLPELADREVLELAKWICRNSRLIERRDRPLPWRRLKQILSTYGCAFSSGGVGNRLNIERTVDRGRRFLGLLPRRERLKIQVFYAGEGREAQRNTVAQIRRELELDEEHGVDSKTFYDGAATSPSEFIVEYRKTLLRLAKL
jgi:death-on-curing family protein